MAFLIDEAYLPATLTASPMTDDEFAALCAEHPDLYFEMTAEADLVIMPPAYTFTSFQNCQIGGQLHDWADRDGSGIVGDGTGGFVLPNGARRSCDANWTAWARIRARPKEERARYLHLCPDFIIELMSQTDRPKAARAKMREWIDNGAQLAWLIDPETKTVEIYRPGRDPEVLREAQSVAGEGPVAGFTLDLVPVWALDADAI